MTHDKAEAVLEDARDAIDYADHLLTVAECAARLSTSSDFIAREIRAGALAAVRRKRPSGRCILRIPEPAFREYLRKTWERA